MQLRWTLPLVAGLLFPALLLAACEDSGQSDRQPAATPTEETVQPVASVEKTETVEAEPVDEGTPVPVTSAEDDPLLRDLLPVAEVAERARRSVVRVETPLGTGSGWVYDSSGHIVTNSHVVSGFGGVPEGEVTVITADGRELVATIVGTDPRTDLALLQVDASDLEPLPLGDLDETRIGEPVVAIGYALNLGESPSVTTGVISAKERAIREETQILGALQTDAAINSGNSGGPLLNLRGQVVGVNTAIDPSGQGIGFAVNVTTVKVVIPELMEKGRVERGLLGIQDFEGLSPALAAQHGVPEAGVLVSQMVPGGPAEQAGVRAGDVLVRLADWEVRVASDVTHALVGHPPGETVEVELYRSGERLTFEVTLGELVPF